MSFGVSPSVAYLEEFATRNLKKDLSGLRPFEMTIKGGRSRWQQWEARSRWQQKAAVHDDKLKGGRLRLQQKAAIRDDMEVESCHS